MLISHGQHGGPDNGLPIIWDFSSNACSVPMPLALQASLLTADRSLYPEPTYAALCEALALWHGVDAARVVPTAGSSEGIRRLTLAVFLAGCRQVYVPQPGYGDYRLAAQALGMAVTPLSQLDDVAEDAVDVAVDGAPVLLWLCEPCNPTGQSLPEAFWLKLAQRLSARSNWIVAIDRAYEPLRLHGADPVAPALAARCWQLYSPNKALGLTGVRAGWMLAPEEDVPKLLPALWRLAPSWVLSAEGVSLLRQWPSATVQNWLAQARATLGTWLAQQQAALADRGWLHQASCTNFTVSRHPDLDEAALNELNACLRAQGIKWRDAGNLGLPGWVRWRAHQPVAQAALLQALDQWMHQQGQSNRSAA